MDFNEFDAMWYCMVAAQHQHIANAIRSISNENYLIFIFRMERNEFQLKWKNLRDYINFLAVKIAIATDRSNWQLVVAVSVNFPNEILDAILFFALFPFPLLHFSQLFFLFIGFSAFLSSQTWTIIFNY